MMAFSVTFLQSSHKYMETILKGVKRRIVIVWESKTERIGE